MRRFLTVAVFLAMPIAAHAQDMNLSQLLIDGEGWKPVGRGFKPIAGLAADREGNLYVAEADPGRVLRIAKDGSIDPLKLEFDALRDLHSRGDGVLVLAVGGKKGVEEDSRIALLNLAKNEVTETRIRGIRDVVATRKAIYYTVPAEKGVFLLNERGGSRKVAAGIDTPAGLALSPDQGTMIVGDSDDKCLWALRIDRDGSLVHKERYFAVWVPRRETASGTARLAVDAVGRVYATTKYGVQMFDPTGRLSGILTNPPGYVPGPIAFGGMDGDVLYVACGDKLYGRKLKTKGVLFGENK